MNKTHNRKRRSVSRLIALFAIFTMLFGCMGCSKKTPREALDEAFEKTFVTDNPTESILGLSEINSHINDNKAYSTGFSVTLQELSGKDISELAGVLSGLGFRIDSSSDLMNRKSAGTMDIIYGGTTYLSLGGQIQGSKLYLTSPQLIDGSLTVDFSTLQEDLSSDAMIGELLRSYGIEIPDELLSELLVAFTDPSSLVDFSKVKASYDDLCDSILVEKLDKKSVDFSSDVSYKKAYRVTIPSYAYSSLINAALQSVSDASADFTKTLGDTEQEQLDMLNLTLQVQQLAETLGNIVLDVAVTKNNHIAYAECNIDTGAEDIRLTASFTGKKNPLNDTDIVLSLTANGQTAKLVFKQDFNPDDNEAAFDFSVKVNDKTELQLSGSGTYTDITKGKKYAFDYDYIELIISDMLTVSLSGDLYVDITECNIPTLSAGERNIFRMSEDDFSALAEEVMTNIEEDKRLSKIMDLLN